MPLEAVVFRYFLWVLWDSLCQCKKVCWPAGQEQIIARWSSFNLAPRRPRNTQLSRSKSHEGNHSGLFWSWFGPLGEGTLPWPFSARCLTPSGPGHWTQPELFPTKLQVHSCSSSISISRYKTKCRCVWDCQHLGFLLTRAQLWALKSRGKGSLPGVNFQDCSARGHQRCGRWTEKAWTAECCLQKKHQSGDGSLGFIHAFQCRWWEGEDEEGLAAFLGHLLPMISVLIFLDFEDWRMQAICKKDSKAEKAPLWVGVPLEASSQELLVFAA